MVLPKRIWSQPSQSQGNSSIDDVRFAELLKPIKDLTVNWSVPLAKYLEDYYEELHDLQINLDGRETKVNFAEAALFLQGTASVYSKKVEFLWQNVLKMLDLLASKKALESGGNDEEEDDVENPGKKRKKKTFDGSQFHLVQIELCKNTNLKSDQAKDGSVHSRKMTLRFIFVTPRQLIEKEGRDMQKMTRVNMYLKSGAGEKYDLLGQKEEFRVNSQFALGTGMIGEELSAESELGQQSVSLCDDSGNNSVFFHAAQAGGDSFAEHTLVNGDNINADQNNPEEIVIAQNGDDQEAPEEAGLNVEDEFAVDNDIGAPDLPDEDDLPELPNGVPEAESPDSKKKRKLAEDFLNEPKAPLEETWEPLEPHEVVTIAKPIRKGRRKKPPVGKPGVGVDASKVVKSFTKSRGGPAAKTNSIYDNTATNNSQNVRVIVPIEEFLIQELRKGGSNISDLSNIASTIRDEAIAELKSRKYKEKDDNENIPDKPFEAEEGVDANDLANAGDWEDFQLDSQDDEMPEPDQDDTLQDLVNPTEASNSQEAEPINKDSYEELVMKRVAAYVAQSQDYIQSTDLAKRVRIWHETLGPKLELVEQRGGFDIHEYGTKVLNKFPQDSRKTTIDFCDIGEGNTPEEVSRLFLSSLMLANSQNVEIGCSAPKNEALPMDQVSLTLLSTQRHHEHMLEAIPESTEEAMATSNKNRKRKKAESGKGNRKNNRNLEIIPEEEAESSTFEKEFEREHQEALEAFDAISVAKKGHEKNSSKHENNPQLANGFTNFSLSPQPSTSSYAAVSSMTTSNFTKSRNATTKGGRNKV